MLKNGVVISLVALMAAAGSAFAQDGRNIRDATDVRVYKSTDEGELNLYIYNPTDHQADDSRGAILFFHGGGWRSGSPSQFAPHCRLLASNGMVAITADYRLIGTHKTPAWRCVEDALSAMRWVRAHAGDLGIDPNRIAVGGGSAGGHLAACIGLNISGFNAEDDDLSVSPAANAMVLFNPAVNIKEIGPRYGWDGRQVDASPLQLVKNGAPPAIIFHGTADQTVPYEHAVAFDEGLRAAGNSCRLVGVEGAGHGFFNFGRGDGSDYTATTTEMVKFLSELGFISSTTP